jgi:hypothetical protein
MTVSDHRDEKEWEPECVHCSCSHQPNHQHTAPRLGEDQELAPSVTIDDHTERERQHEERNPLRCTEHPEFSGGHLQDRDRDERDRELPDLVSQDRRPLSEPEQTEILAPLLRPLARCPNGR